ncbi:tripartite motif-containing protein 15-like [Dermochelys coriacea]|uniref:tripartite motif-containing protein 15-like n=1 Tax=Dermochelys coriacea TaxID=27794 RepID=UPI001CA85E48|nr:tripartite motif-containing protein 15-like [Dermochelys coriacea]
MAGAGSAARRLLQPRGPRGAGRAREAPEECLAPLQKEREVAKAEEKRQNEELLKQMEVERQKIIWEWKELQGFLEEQEQLLLFQLEELERAIVQRRDQGLCKLSEEISVLSEREGEKGQQPLSQSLQADAYFLPCKVHGQKLSPMTTSQQGSLGGGSCSPDTNLSV